MKDYDPGNAPDLGKALARAASGEAPRRVEIDIEKYQAYLDHSGMDDAQKAEWLNALWTIIVAFVDLGFGVHPAQQACGQLEKILDPDPKRDSHRLSSGQDSLSEHFNDAPDRQ